MSKRFLNAQYSGRKTEISVTDAVRLCEVQVKIKEMFGDDIPCAAAYIQLFNKDQLIAKLKDISAEYYEEDGDSYLDIRILPSASEAHLIQGKLFIGGFSEVNMIEVNSQVAVYESDASIPARLVADSGSGFPLFLGAKIFDSLVLIGNRAPYVQSLNMETFHGVVEKAVDALMVRVVVTDNCGGIHGAVMEAYKNDGDVCLLGLLGMELLHLTLDCPQKTLRPQKTFACSHFMLKNDGRTVLQPWQPSTLEKMNKSAVHVPDDPKQRLIAMGFEEASVVTALAAANGYASVACRELLKC